MAIIKQHIDTTQSGAIVLIHGFNGEPADMEYLHDYLAAKGLTSYLLKLNGHGGKRLDMARNGCQSWLNGVRRDMGEIAARHTHVHLVGFSMGGLLAANVAKSFNVEKLVFVNTPIYFWNLSQIAANIRNDLKLKTYGKIKYYFCASHSAPLLSLLNFVRILLLSKPKFKNITNRALILQTKNDDTVQPRSALYIKTKLKGPVKLVWFATGGHMLFADARREEAANAVYTFLTSEEG